MKIYTRTGDEGETALFGAGRVGKGHVRVEAMGAVDELNASVGWAVAQLAPGPDSDRLERVQHDLFALGAELATPPAAEGRVRPRTPGLEAERTRQLETWIDEMTAELPDLSAFVLPGGTSTAAALHLTRTVCRRAERAVVRLAESEGVELGLIAYLNRLSDLLFTLARAANHSSGRGDVEWAKP